VFRSETPIPVSIPAGETLQVNLLMQNHQAGEYEQPVTIYLEVEGQLIEKSATLKGQAVPAPEQPSVAETPSDQAAVAENGQSISE
jgi:hypothetical protein